MFELVAVAVAVAVAVVVVERVELVACRACRSGYLVAAASGAAMPGATGRARGIRG